MALTDREARREQRQKDREDARAQRADRDFETLLATSPSEITATDGLGIERIVTSTTGYEAPQTDPDPREVERLQGVFSRLDNKKQERLAQLTAVPDGGGEVAKAALEAEASNLASTSEVAPSDTPETPVVEESESPAQRRRRERAEARNEASAPEVTPEVTPEETSETPEETS